MYSVLVILAVIVAVLLALIVLIQESKGGGLASNFAASNQIMVYANNGCRRENNLGSRCIGCLGCNNYSLLPHY